jgi:tRNA A37 threonylcarbamoyladenosine dehydratase
LDPGCYQVDGPVALGAVDVISGGAITNAALCALLRMPGMTAAIRIIEPDLLALANLNRYALALRSMLRWPKIRALRTFQTPRLTIT